MATMADDIRGGADVRVGLLLAIASAASFGLSGALARGLIDVGWSPGAVVLARIAVAALVVAPLAARALRGRWGLLRSNARTVLIYGAVPVAGTQFAYFSAVAAMDVGPALLIEYTAPAAIVVWLWLRHGERPRPLTLAGAGLAALGLVLVLDLLSGADLALDGVLWALAAMLGAATYFVMSADTRSGVPPLALAGGGLAVGTVGLGLLGDHRRPADATRRPPRRPTPAKPSPGGCRSSRSAWSPRPSPTPPASRRAAGSARGWRRSWRCSRSSRRSSSRGCCSISSRERCSSPAERSSWPA